MMTRLEARLQFLCCALRFLGAWSHFMCRPDSLLDFVLFVMPHKKDKVSAILRCRNSITTLKNIGRRSQNGQSRALDEDKLSTLSPINGAFVHRGSSYCRP